MLQKIIDKTIKYQKDQSKSSRKKKGQFFTPANVAEFMAKHSAISAEHIKILEPGAGNGILSASLVFYLVNNGMCRSFTVDLVENDTDIIPVLHNTAGLLTEYVKEHGGDVKVNIHTCNYLIKMPEQKYDIVVCNPPYKKIRKDSPEALSMKQYVHGQPNLYALFMCKAVNMLKSGGHFAFITPRSWTSGNYYKKTREYILANINIKDLVLFKDRTGVFEGEDVLQETLITIGEKKDQQTDISIYQSVTLEEEPLVVNSRYIKSIGEDSYLLLPTSEDEVKIICNMIRKKDTFASLGYCFKTGPVVEFRNEELLSAEKKEGYIPMFRSSNILNGRFTFPAPVGKAQYIKEKKKNLLIADTNTVFLRRLSSKEEKRRLQSCVYYGKDQNSYIAVENHVNYLVRKDGKPLTKEEVERIQGILASDEYDTYYRLINGSTQVNASEINKLPLAGEEEKNEEKRRKVPVQMS